MDQLRYSPSNVILVSAVDAHFDMYLLAIGLLLLLMKYMEIGPVAAWSWLVVLAPFALAVVWWTWADWSGYTKRKAVQKENAKRQARIDKSKEKLGMPTSKKR
jgi:small Trp-rich protein